MIRKKKSESDNMHQQGGMQQESGIHQSDKQQQQQQSDINRVQQDKDTYLTGMHGKEQHDMQNQQQSGNVGSSKSHDMQHHQMHHQSGDKSGKQDEHMQQHSGGNKQHDMQHHDIHHEVHHESGNDAMQHQDATTDVLHPSPEILHPGEEKDKHSSGTTAAGKGNRDQGVDAMKPDHKDMSGSMDSHQSKTGGKSDEHSHMSNESGGKQTAMTK